ncbi:MAG: aldehyde dehydrogenase family protein, partial [Hyphomonas sp.]
MRDIHHFINGAAVTGTSGRFGDIYDPNTGEVQARVVLATAAELGAAVDAAKTAFPAWATTNP